jgi:hypothetical protein
MNVEIGAEAALFPEKEYISVIFVAVHELQVPGVLTLRRKQFDPTVGALCAHSLLVAWAYDAKSQFPCSRMSLVRFRIITAWA